MFTNCTFLGGGSDPRLLGKMTTISYAMMKVGKV
jgi:hypothetical protein